MINRRQLFGFLPLPFISRIKTNNEPTNVKNLPEIHSKDNKTIDNWLELWNLASLTSKNNTITKNNTIEGRELKVWLNQKNHFTSYYGHTYWGECVLKMHHNNLGFYPSLDNAYRLNLNPCTESIIVKIFSLPYESFYRK